jgi:hypothetical protein
MVYINENGDQTLSATLIFFFGTPDDLSGTVTIGDLAGPLAHISPWHGICKRYVFAQL